LLLSRSLVMNFISLLGKNRPLLIEQEALKGLKVGKIEHPTTHVTILLINDTSVQNLQLGERLRSEVLCQLSNLS